MPLHKKIINAVLIALIMSMCMSLVMTVINVGLNGHFFPIWLRNWGVGFSIAFPLSLFLPPAVQKCLGQSDQAPPTQGTND